MSEFPKVIPGISRFTIFTRSKTRSEENRYKPKLISFSYTTIIENKKIENNETATFQPALKFIHVVGQLPPI